MPALLPLYATLDPDTYGGAVLLGVDGVCVISHGSTGATAMLNAHQRRRGDGRGRPRRRAATRSRSGAVPTAAQ